MKRLIHYRLHATEVMLARRLWHALMTAVLPRWLAHGYAASESSDVEPLPASPSEADNSAYSSTPTKRVEPWYVRSAVSFRLVQNSLHELNNCLDGRPWQNKSRKFYTFITLPTTCHRGRVVNALGLPCAVERDVLSGLGLTQPGRIRPSKTNNYF